MTLTKKIAALEKEIHALDAKRASLQRQLNDLKSLKLSSSSAPVTQLSSNAEKIVYFVNCLKAVKMSILGAGKTAKPESQVIRLFVVMNGKKVSVINPESNAACVNTRYFCR